MPYRIALICVFLPLISVHLTLSIAILFDNLTLCIPYWANCHSISATGRQYPEFFVFKALLIPTAVLMAAYWLMLHQWVLKMNSHKSSPTIVTGMGLIAAIALIVYTVTLGAVGEPYALARRIGVVFYFAFSSFAHLILLKHLQQIDSVRHGIVKEQKHLTISCLILVISAIASAVAGFVWEQWWDSWENAYEWWFSLLMISLFYQVAQMWKKTQFTLSLTLRSPT